MFGDVKYTFDQDLIIGQSNVRQHKDLYTKVLHDRSGDCLRSASNHGKP